MLEKFFAGKKSIRKIWFLSYLCVLLIPILISGIMFAKSKDILEKEICTSNLALLKGIQEHADTLLVNIEQISGSMLLNTRLRTIANMDHINEPADKYFIIETANDLKAYTASQKLINHLYIYYKKTDCVLAPDVVQDSKTYFDIHLNETGVSYTDWMDVINTNERGSKIIVLDGENDSKTVLFLSTFPEYGGTDVAASVVIGMDSHGLIASEQELESFKKGRLIILDDSNNVITSSNGNADKFDINYEDLNTGNNFLKTTVNGEKMMVFYKSSEVVDWKYAFVIEEKNALGELHHLNRIVFLCFILNGCLGIALIVYFIEKNYKPVKAVVGVLSGEENAVNKEDEFQFIRKTIEDTLDKYEDIKDTLERQYNPMKSSFLTDFLRGNKTEDIALEESLSYYDIHFNGDGFLVVLFDINDCSALFYEKEEHAQDDNLKKAVFIIQNIMTELFEKFYYTACVEIDNTVVNIINFDVEAADPAALLRVKEHIKDCIDAGGRFMREHFNLSFFASVSNFYFAVDQLPYAYHETLKVLEYKKVMGADEIIFYDDICNVSNNVLYYYPLEVEIKLINCIETGDFDKVREILKEVFERNFSDSLLSVQMTKCLMFDIVGTMVKTFDKYSTKEDREFILKLNCTERLLNCGTIANMKSELMNILEAFCSYVSTKRKNSNMELIYKICEFVNEYYSDINLNVSFVAKEFDLHTNTVSRIFKQQMGVGLLDYINKIRIEKAELLLKTQDYTVEEVAIKTGFSNLRTFTRVFSKNTGVTPGKYKITK